MELGPLRSGAHAVARGEAQIHGHDLFNIADIKIADATGGRNHRERVNCRHELRLRHIAG